MVRIIGTKKKNALAGTSASDIVKGLAGNDTLRGGNGSDSLNGGAGRDKLFGDAGNDKILGGSGIDSILGGVGNDRLFGQSGNDTITGGRGNDSISGGAGTDNAVFSGAFAEYNITRSGSSFVLSHARGSAADGVDRVLSDIEFLKFTDRTVSMTELRNGTTPGGTGSAPNAGDDTFSVTEKGILLGLSVLGNDADIDVQLGIDSLLVSAVNGVASAIGQTIELASGARLTMQASGTFTYDTNGAFDSLGNGEMATETFQYEVRDSTGKTDTATVSIQIEGSNDAPVIIVDPSSILNLLDLLEINVSPNIDISDVDDQVLQSAQVVISDGFQLGDQLLFDGLGDITGVFDDATGILNLTGAGTVADYEAALQSVTFAVDGLLGLPIGIGQREISFLVSDGDVTSAATAASTALLDVVLL